MHIFCDESGNTGVDLLNKDQPVFSLASTCIDTRAAEDLIERLTEGRPKEAKYSRLKATRRGQQRLLDFFDSPELTSENSKVNLTDKKYYLISHLVDKLVEPPLHEAKIDLYERDAHVGLTNVWYFAGHTIFPAGQWDKVLTAFQQAIRRRTKASFAEFDSTLKRAARRTPHESRDFATGILLAAGRLDEFIGVYGDMEVFDPAVDMFSSLIQAWMLQEPGMLVVSHDVSKPLRRSENLLRALMTPAAKRIIGYSGRQAELPLRISELEFCDSMAYAQIQVADVLAGAASDWLLVQSGRKPGSDFHSALGAGRLMPLLIGGMLPDPEFVHSVALPARAGERSLAEGTKEFLEEVGFFKDRGQSEG